MRTRGVESVRLYSRKHLEKEILSDSVVVDKPKAQAYGFILEWLNPVNEPSQPNAEIIHALDYVPYFEKRLVKEHSCRIYIHFQQNFSSRLKLPEPLLGGDGDFILPILRTMSEIRKHYLYPLQFLNLSPIMASEVTSIVVECLKQTVCPKERPFISLLDALFAQYPIWQSEVSLEAYQILLDCHMETIANRVVAHALLNEVKNFIYESYSRVWNVSVWSDFTSWLKESMMPALNRLLIGQPYEDNDLLSAQEAYLSKCAELYLVDLRVSEIFDIVLAYPGSTGALNDLRSNLVLPSQRAAVVNAFQKSCSARLLQGGTNTIDIIAAYIATVRSFTVIDPKGVLLSKVIRPIRRYLRDRDDAVSVIVSGFLGNAGPEIDELADIITQDSSDEKLKLAEKDDLLDLNWFPDPVDAPVDFVRDNIQDIVNSLLSIYDNKEIFVRELMNVFAYNMLSQPADSSRAIFDLDSLKSRFEERELQSLEVMVRDIVQSEQVRQKIINDPPSGAVELDPKIVSGLFWPSFRPNTYLFPRQIEESLSEFSENFSRVKHGRKLDWVKSAGYVVLELELASRKEELQVTPDQATIIMHFQEGPRTIEQLKEATQMTETGVKGCISFWVSRGILELQGSEYHVIETNDGTTSKGTSDDMAATLLQADEERAKEEMKVYWQYIVGMLTNLGAKPSEQIHSFLKMLVPKETPYTKSESELSKYLNQMVDEGKLELVAGGMFKLKK